MSWLLKWLFPDQLSVCILRGDLCEQQADILVNSAPDVLTTGKGAVLVALLKTGGKELANEFVANHPGRLEPGKAFYTSGHMLPCQMVCYMCLPAYGSGVEEVLDNLITSCLTEANNKGLKSVAFPALGTGSLCYPPAVFARTILGAVSKFNKARSTTTLRDVRIVIDCQKPEIFTRVQEVYDQMGSFKTDAKVTSASPANSELRLLLVATTPEYQTVMGNFTSSLGRRTTIISIERIRNKRLRKQYNTQKDHLDKQNNGHENQKTLWHGTHPAAIDGIIRNGFNRSFCGLNATAYGQGVYFADLSEYSANDTYSKPDASGHKRVFQCKVLAGHAVLGDPNMKVLPDRLPSIPYDSARNSDTSPMIYVCFNDNSAYPEYLITFV